MSGTIRSRMVKQQERHPEVKRLEGATGWSYECGGCGRYWPCPDRVAADDTLTDWKLLMLLLAEAERGISFLGDSKSILQQILAADADPDSRGV